MKPSELTPLSAINLMGALLEAGLPHEIVTVAVGGLELGKALVSAREIRMVSFTGGFATADAITRLAGLKKLATELGGNAPVIVMNDCDLDAAVEAAYPAPSGPPDKTASERNVCWCNRRSMNGSAMLSLQPRINSGWVTR